MERAAQTLKKDRPAFYELREGLPPNLGGE